MITESYSMFFNVDGTLATMKSDVVVVISRAGYMKMAIDYTHFLFSGKSRNIINFVSHSIIKVLYPL